MKKLYAFFAAALMSASMYAAAPTAADLAAEYDVVNNVVFCIQFIEDAEVCNDIRFVGTPNGWGKGLDAPEGAVESWDNCEKFAPVPGFDGWYAAELPYSEGFEGKPLQEPTNRAWTWDYQCGDINAWVHVDGLELSLSEGFADECNIAASAPGAYIYQLKYWKKHKSPCVAVVEHDYTIKLYAPDACSEMKPAIIGDFNGWSAGVAMNEGLDEEFNTVYTYSFHDQEGHGFKIKEATDTDWTNEMQYYDTENDAWKNFQNFELGAETEIVLEYSDNDLYRYAKCDASPSEYTVFTVNLPSENAPEAVEIIGTFDGWQGTAMEKLNNGWFFVELEAKESQYFKFRSAGSWNKEIEIKNDESGEWAKIGDNALVFGQLWQDDTYKGTPCKWIELDMSDPAKYRWSVAEQGIENVVLTEKAQKVVVDGVLYIVRDNKMYNAQGTQVR